MRRISDTEVFTTSPYAMGPGRFPNVGLSAVLIQLTATGAGDVLLKLTRGSVTTTLNTFAMTGKTAGAVYFEAPVVLTDADILTIDASAAGHGGTAIIQTEQE